MVAVCVDDVEKNAALAKKLGLTFPVLADTSRSVAKAYGVLDREAEIAWPVLYVLDGKRTIVWRSMYDNYKERPSAKTVLEQVGKQ